MTTLKFQATEMKSAKVERISLVSRGANRIPIRIVKEDATMSKSPLGDFDLARVFTRKSEPAAPVVTGIITQKGEGFDALKAKIAEAGFVVEKAAESKEGETTVVAFQQGDETVSDKDVVIKMSPDVAVVAKGFRPYAVDMAVGDATFSEACAAQGFYPGISTMVDVLRSSVYETVSKADNPAEAATAIKKMFTEVESYVVGLVQALPSKAFKLEQVVADEEHGGGSGGAGKEEEKPTEETKKSEEKPAAEEGAKDGEKTEAKKDEKADEKTEQKPVEKSEKTTDKAPEAAPALKAEDVEKMLGTAFAKLSEGLTATVTKSVAEVKESVEALGKRVGEVEGVAKAAKEAVEGTVLGSDADDHVEQTQKSDNGGQRGREIDTAFAPRRRPAR